MYSTPLEPAGIDTIAAVRAWSLRMYVYTRYDMTHTPWYHTGPKYKEGAFRLPHTVQTCPMLTIRLAKPCPQPHSC